MPFAAPPWRLQHVAGVAVARLDTRARRSRTEPAPQALTVPRQASRLPSGVR
jgi:hypothetical protein